MPVRLTPRPRQYGTRTYSWATCRHVWPTDSELVAEEQWKEANDRRRSGGNQIVPLQPASSSELGSVAVKTAVPASSSFGTGSRVPLLESTFTAARGVSGDFGLECSPIADNYLPAKVSGGDVLSASSPALPPGQIRPAMISE